MHQRVVSDAISYSSVVLRSKVGCEPKIHTRLACT